MKERNLKNVTVKTETMSRLNRRRAEMEMAAEGSERISLDTLINRLLDKEEGHGKG